MDAATRRAYWVAELAKLSGSFVNDCDKMVVELEAEIARDGVQALLDHLRFCGAMPELYGHDSSAEKLYSKYTDAVISAVFSYIGLKSVVLAERADAADVQAEGVGYSLVADAKAFRLSRTAKNQKDFKIQALDGWRGKMDFAVVVCPIYQLPTRQSQIYQQAITRNVCILSYTHLAVLVRLTESVSAQRAESAFHEMLKAVGTLAPSKAAADYWTGVNSALLKSLGAESALWVDEKKRSLQELTAVKKESLTVLSTAKKRLMGLSHKEALAELMLVSGLDSKIDFVSNVEHGNLLELV